jgi:3-oxoacyl-[acyl-carrier-protein] synthase II
LGHGGAADAWDQTAPHPKGEGLLRAAHAALKRAGLQASDVGRYHAHGTATQQNDDMEAQVCAALFGPRGRPLTAFKGSLGHTLGAAAALDAIGTICALSRGELWPVVGHTQPQESHALDVVTARRAHTHPIALVATAGFGGVNGALVLSRGTA